MGETSNPEREKRILAAAAELIAHYGYDKTTVDEIAREAGISKGAVYLHFKSKDDLFEALLLRESEALAERFFELLDADPQGVTLFNIYRYGLVVADESPLIKAIYTHDRRVLGDYVRHVRNTSAYGQAAHFSVDFVRYFQQAGLIRSDLDPEAVAYLLIALRYGVLTMDDALPDDMKVPPVVQLGDTLAELLANGIAPREGEADTETARQVLRQLMDVRLEFIRQRQHKQD